jgi:type I restriction enzyme S subunit
MNRWSAVRLGELADGVDYGLTASATVDEVGPKFLRITDIQDGNVDWDTVPYCSCDTNDLGRYALARGDILFARTGATTGKSYLIREYPPNTVFASYLIRIRPNVRVDPRYLAYFFDTPDYWNQVSLCAQGAGQPGINASKLKELSLPLPPLAEQKRIAAILDQADAIRRKRRNAIEAAADLPLAIFLDMFGDPSANRERWPVVPMGQLFASPPNYGTMQQPFSHPSGWLDLRVANIQEGVLDLSDRKYVELEPTMISRHEVRDGDLLLARAIGSKEHLGKCIVARPGLERWAFDSHLMRIRLDAERGTPEFVQAFLASPGGRHEFLRHTRRSAVQFNVNTKEMAQVELPLPPIELQQEFVRTLTRMRSMQDIMSSALAKADRLYRSLISRAFLGTL